MARQARKAIQSRGVTAASYRRVPPSVTWTIPYRVIAGMAYRSGSLGRAMNSAFAYAAS